MNTFNSYSNVVRSNNRGFMTRTVFPSTGEVRYGVFDIETQAWKHVGKRKTAARGWQRYFANTRQYSTPNGVNHRYLFDQLS